MPSPVTGEDFDIQNFSGDVCERIRKLLELNNTLKTFFEWFLNDDGTVSSEFKLLIQDIATPVGGILFRPVASVPNGYLIANGAAVSRTTYANLFSVYGTAFGAGDGSTTFNLPDLQRTFLLGSGGDIGVGDEGGEEEHTLTPAETPEHDHDMPTDAFGIRTTLDQNAVGTADNSSSGGGGFVGRATFAEVGGGQAHNNMPPYMAGLWLIKT